MPSSSKTEHAVVDRLSRAFESLVTLLFGLACLLLLAMTFMIGADVLTRNLEIASMSWSNEVSEWLLSWTTLLSAPLLLRRGQHIRVDVLLQVLPARVGWFCEWIVDVLGLLCSVVLAVYGWRVTDEAYVAGSLITKTLETPEWWATTPWSICFSLMSVEFVFRMHRLARAPHQPRHDAVSAA